MPFTERCGLSGSKFHGSLRVQSVHYTSNSGQFFQINVSISGHLQENLSLNYELNGSCAVQIGWVEVEICNLKDDLHTNFPIFFNGKSGSLSFTVVIPYP